MTTADTTVLERFEENLILERHAALATRETYVRELACFLNYLTDNKLDYSSVTSAQLKNYLLFRADSSSLSSRTQARILTVLRLFFSMAVEDNVRNDNPTEALASLKIHINLPKTVDSDTLTNIFNSIDVSTPLGFRDRTIFELIYSCGLRVSECVNLKINDYYRTEKRIIITGKGDKQRMLPVGDIAISYIEQYLESVRPLFKQKIKCSNMFLSQKGLPISRQEIWNRLDYYGSNAGVHLKVHSLRHSFATDMLRNGADLRSVQELLGHSDIRTTEIYTHVNTDDLLKAFDMCHPDGRKKN